MICKILILSVFFLFSLSILHALDYTLPPNTYSIQSGDFDNDGDNDIVVGHNYEWGFLTFLENLGNGEFAISDTMHSFGSIAVYPPCNIDNESGMEIITNYQDGFGSTVQLLIFYNNDLLNPYYYDSGEIIPFGHFNPGDFDNDGDYDLVFSSSGAGYDNLWGVMYNLGNREFSEPEWFECPNQASNAGFYELECRDLDNNGFDDIIAYTNPETYIYYSDGNSFELDSLNCYAANGTMVSEDMDNDGDYDIVVSHMFNGTTFKFYENIGDHQFEYHEQIIEGGYAKAYPCDINDDQYPDIVNIFGGACFWIHYNTGNFQLYTEVIDLTSYGELWTKPTFSDFDGNGTEDIAFIRYGIEENNLTILYNDGEGNFLDDPVSANNYELPITNYELNNFPNPFNPSTTISFDLNKNIENPIIEIFNIKGERIRELKIENEKCKINTVVWDGKDNYRKPVSSGVYLYRLKTDEGVLISRKMLLLK